MKTQSNTCDCDAIHPEAIRHVQTNLPLTDLMGMTQLFRIMGDNTRSRILMCLGIHELCVCDLAVLLNMTKSAVSHQLDVLKKNGLVCSRKQGKNVFYSLDDDHVAQILRMALAHVQHELTLSGKDAAE